MHTMIKTTVWRKKIYCLWLVWSWQAGTTHGTSVPFHIAVLGDRDHLRGKSLAEGTAKKEPL
jgi:hypothetical protein